jgi:hypothetical protein
MKASDLIDRFIQSSRQDRRYNYKPSNQDSVAGFFKEWIINSTFWKSRVYALQVKLIRLDLIIMMITFYELIFSTNRSDRYCFKFQYFRTLKLNIYQAIFINW